MLFTQGIFIDTSKGLSFSRFLSSFRYLGILSDILLSYELLKYIYEQRWRLRQQEPHTKIHNHKE
ncbi:hypothetical protein B488_06800 [Liberibacter crescens BT-1]|uniref:Uncharacterized protein n=1 Tax=Liberibacter crescens (strain BT-1) TaxID=1215343 RepID=L0EUN2_LIBCB|nr:hypothetical protein B488_06800 [Liberibacter crescens BT-1]AMC12773.1 hypothetical protein RL73_03490 [Liberibacter crescens]